MNRASRFESYFYFFMALVIAAIVAYGFGQTAEERLIHPAVPRPLILYVHAALFSGWVLFFILQAALVRARAVHWHQRVGWFGVALGVAMPVVGVSTAIGMGRFNVSQLHARFPEANLLISLFDITAFTVPFFLAVAYRGRPNVHRRLQLIAICALTAAAFGRFPNDFFRHGRPHGDVAFAFLLWATLYAGVDVLVVFAMTRDLVVDRRVHAVYRYGLPALLLCQALVVYAVARRPAWWMNAARAVLS